MTDQTDEIRKQRQARNRARAWEWARSVGQRPRNAWALDRFKAVLALTADGSHDLPERRAGQFSLLAALRASAAVLIALGMWLLYTIRHRAGVGQRPLRKDVKRLFALHGEYSTRTRHLLSEVSSVVPTAVLLLGRSRNTPQSVRALWAQKLPPALPSDLGVLMPLSPSACLGAMLDLPRLLGGGIAHSARATVNLGWREEAAIAFRVILGATAARWWRRQGFAVDVWFGQTGTADTMLLEEAIHNAGGKSIHVVHGQATGPNFVGFSDKALFRSRHDAQAYEWLACYGHCLVQSAPAPMPVRGRSGILLLTNLAHPMNSGYQRNGLRDELAILDATAAAAKMLGTVAQPVLWKPHPALAQLPHETQQALHAAAQQRDLTMLPPEADITELAGQNRWVVCSPSTVALDLLQEGSLPLVLDPQGTVLDTALLHLPQAETTPDALRAELTALDPGAAYGEKLATAHTAIGPARALDMLGKLE